MTIEGMVFVYFILLGLAFLLTLLAVGWWMGS